MGEIKQFNFRLNQETADKFRAFCESEGFNQAQGFDHLVQVMEIDKAKVIVPERKMEIESFEMHIKAILEAYLNGLELTKNAEERVRENFKSSLESKDKSIAMLQDKIENLNEKVKEAKEQEAIAKSAKDDAEKRLNQAEKEVAAAHEIADKSQKINDMLAGKMAEAEADLAEFKQIKATSKEKDDIINKLKQDSQEQAKQMADAEKDHAIALERAIEKANMQIASLKRDLEEAQKLSQRDREALEAKYEAAQALAIEKAVRASEKLLAGEYEAKMEKIKEENIRLKIQVENMNKGE